MKERIVYMMLENSNDDDVTLVKFHSFTEFTDYITENVHNMGDFHVTDVIEQSGTVFGFPVDDYDWSANVLG